jgi:Na+/H+ antiporter NhaD/arsenite permease-like protein
MAVPTLLASRMKPFQGYLSSNDEIEETEYTRYGRAMLFIGLGMIVFVPVFKTITHLPPWVGMILSVSIVAFIAEIFSKGDFDMTNAHIDKGKDEHHHPIVHKALTKIEMPSILFFLGILIAVAGLESLGYLFNFATWVDIKCPNKDIVIGLLGAGSAIIDNVPLVAASLGMFSEPVNDQLWHFTAYSAGTGGSMLIIGSAAGVVAMGMEKIDFIWYFRKISWLAATGFVAGGFTFILMRDYVWL